MTQERTDAIVENLKAQFGDLSLDVLSRASGEFLKLAEARLNAERQINAGELEAKKELIDENLRRMNSELDRVSRLIVALEKDRVRKFGDLSARLKVSAEQNSALLATTNALREALAGSKSRGQWGERMAEDILRMAGFMENVNYLKQQTMPGTGNRPDFTFLLPRGLTVNMDVKFPLDNYIRCLEAEEPQRETYRNQFLKDVRSRIREVTSRGYIDPENNTLDFVLLFIPNERIYAFIFEAEPGILDEGFSRGVVLCSPASLFAMLAVIRQAADNFALERTSRELLTLFGTFQSEWDKFQDQFHVLGKRIEDTRQAFHALTTTRRTKLEKPLLEIEQLRKQRFLDPASDTIGKPNAPKTPPKEQIE